VSALARLWRWLTARHLVCGCCWAPYREGRARPCGCATDPADENRCVVHGPDVQRTEHPCRQLVVEAPRRPWSKPVAMPVAGPGRPRSG